MNIQHKEKTLLLKMKEAIQKFQKLPSIWYRLYVTARAMQRNRSNLQNPATDEPSTDSLVVCFKNIVVLPWMN